MGRGRRLPDLPATAVAGVGAPGAGERGDGGLVAVEALALADHLAVPVEPERGQVQRAGRARAPRWPGPGRGPPSARGTRCPPTAPRSQATSAVRRLPRWSGARGARGEPSGGHGSSLAARPAVAGRACRRTLLRMADLGGEPLRFGTAAGRWVLLGTVLGSGMTMLDGTVVNLALPAWATTSTPTSPDSSGSSTATRSPWRRSSSSAARSATDSVADASSRSVWSGSPLASLLLRAGPDGRASSSRRGCSRASAVPCWSPAAWPSSSPRSTPTTGPGRSARWSGLGGVTTAIGPFLGGWLVDAASWRWIFLINVPLGALVLYVAVAHLPESRDPTIGGRLDLPGAVLGALGLAGITYGFIEQDVPVGLARRRAVRRLRPGRAAHPSPDAVALGLPIEAVQRGQRRHLRDVRRPGHGPVPHRTGPPGGAGLHARWRPASPRSRSRS